MNLTVSCDFMSLEEASRYVDLSKLPENVSESIRIVRVGDYDACACIGDHVGNTSQTGRMKLLNHDFENGRWRVRFKLEGTPE
jgi:Ser-tRNA(Ala) deacylase AlaX